MSITTWETFKRDAADIGSSFPGLTYAENENGQPYVTGTLTLTDKGGDYVDAYSIEIHPSPGYPYRFPLVFEKGGRIPVNIDWHVYPQSGNCCLKSVPEEWLQCKKGVALISFIENDVKPYFFHQLFREQNGYFLKERSHGDKGNIEFIEELTGTKDLRKIADILLFASKRAEPGRTADCFCGSGNKYRHCHRPAFRTLVLFTDPELKQLIDLVNLALFRQMFPGHKNIN